MLPWYFSVEYILIYLPVMILTFLLSYNTPVISKKRGYNLLLAGAILIIYSLLVAINKKDLSELIAFFLSWPVLIGIMLFSKKRKIAQPNDRLSKYDK